MTDSTVELTTVSSMATVCYKTDRLSARYYCNAVLIITDERKTRTKEVPLCVTRQLLTAFDSVPPLNVPLMTVPPLKLCADIGVDFGECATCVERESDFQF